MEVRVTTTNMVDRGTVREAFLFAMDGRNEVEVFFDLDDGDLVFCAPDDGKIFIWPNKEPIARVKCKETGMIFLDCEDFDRESLSETSIQFNKSPLFSSVSCADTLIKVLDSKGFFDE